MLKYGDAIELGVRHALHGAPAPELSERWLVNAAGQHLCSMHTWQWLERPLTPLSLFAGQDFIELPDDCQDVLDLSSNGLVNYDIRRSTLGDIQSLRRTDIQMIAGVLYWAMIYQNPATTPDDTRGVRATLQVYPTPTEDALDVLLLKYRSGWTRVSASSSEDQALPLPDDDSCTTLYISLLRAFAHGFEEDARATEGNGPTLSRQLAEIEMGPLFQAAKRADARRLPFLGTIRNGVVSASQERGRAPRQYLDRPVTGYTAL